MSDKYLNIDLNDPRASAIADVMGNKTAKKILDLIAEKEVSESDIASELKLPLNTVGYNIDKLLKAELIEKSKTFFWSVKGKKIPTYTLSNRKILISPRRLTVSPIAIIASILGVVLIIAILMNLSENGNNSIIFSGNGSVHTENGLKQFSSYEELDNFLNDSLSQNTNSYYSTRSGANIEFANDAAETVGFGATGAVAPSEAKSSADSYSQTNIQVEGVDEPDFVKNDGKYIYMISGQNLYIVLAYPANEMKIIANVSLSDYATNMFLNGDKLVVFSNGYKEYETLGTPQGISSKMMATDSIMPCRGYGCGGYSKSLTNVLVYNIKDKENPVVEQNYSFDGSYVDARMIGNNIYLISQNYINNNWPKPLYYSNGVEKEVSLSDIYYSPELDGNFVFTSISAISLSNSEVNTKVYLLGTSGTIYVSENNIYLTTQKYLSYDKQIEMKIKEGILPVMPSDYQTQIDEIIKNDNYYDKESRVMKLVFEYSNSLDKDAQSDFNKEFEKSLSDAEAKIAKEYQKTAVRKIAIDEMDINYVAEGEIYGYLLNQFSLDEFDGNLRVVVTTGNVWGGKSNNALYVLDEGLNQIGSVENIASGETIYSARFMGGRAHLVTFKTVDPLFVLDLSDGRDPKILGYLKIPGYSNYMHPYDENHVIGIGKDVDESIDADKVHTEGAVYYTAIKGLKISIFDVSNVEHPIESAKIVLGERGSDSLGLSDHRAFLFDKEKGILVLPVSLTKLENVSYDYGYGKQTYEQEVVKFSGAYVFNINVDDISVRGKITHNEEKEYLKPAKEESVGAERKDAAGNIWAKIAVNAWKTDASGLEYETYSDYQIDIFPNGYEAGKNSYYDYNKQIQRSLFMDDVLYTVSLGMIKANDINTIDELNKVEISESYDSPYGILY